MVFQTNLVVSFVVVVTEVMGELRGTLDLSCSRTNTIYLIVLKNLLFLILSKAVGEQLQRSLRRSRVLYILYLNLGRRLIGIRAKGMMLFCDLRFQLLF